MAVVLSKKKQQLLSSVFIILVLMLSSSLCMYSVENAAQPKVFANAFSGIWWSASTLLTVGYGDIYPITTLGRVLGAIITFLGVGMVAIPTASSPPASWSSTPRCRTEGAARGIWRSASSRSGWAPETLGSAKTWSSCACPTT